MTGAHALVLALAAAPVGGLQGFLAGPGQLLPLVAVGVLFYFMMWRPQQRRMREHTARVGGIKRGDTVVLSSGHDRQGGARGRRRARGLEIAQNVTVKVVKTMVSEVRARGEPAAANDAKS